MNFSNSSRKGSSRAGTRRILSILPMRWRDCLLTTGVPSWEFGIRLDNVPRMGVNNGRSSLSRCSKQSSRCGSAVNALLPFPQWSRSDNKSKPFRRPSGQGFQNRLSDQGHRKSVPNPVRAHLVDKWVDLQLAIEQSLLAPVESARMPFVIGTHFARIQMEPKTAVHRVIASARGIDD